MDAKHMHVRSILSIPNDLDVYNLTRQKKDFVLSRFTPKDVNFHFGNII